MLVVTHCFVHFRPKKIVFYQLTTFVRIGSHLFLFILDFFRRFLAVLKDVVILTELMPQGRRGRFLNLIMNLFFAFTTLHALRFRLLPPIRSFHLAFLFTESRKEVVEGRLIPHAHRQPLRILSFLRALLTSLVAYLLLLVLFLQIIGKSDSFVRFGCDSLF